MIAKLTGIPHRRGAHQAFLFLNLLAIVLAVHSTAGFAIEVEFLIKNKDTQEKIPARCRLIDSNGNSIRPADESYSPIPGSPDFFCEGSFKIDLEANRPYRFETYRSEAWMPSSSVLTVTETGRMATCLMSRYVNLFYNRWYAGDLEVDVPLGKLPLLMGASDLNTACHVAAPAKVIEPTSQKQLGVYHYPGMRAYSGYDWDLGDFNIIGALRQLAPDEKPYNGSQLSMLKKGRDQAGYIDATNLSGEEVPVAAALGWIDFMRVAGPLKGGSDDWSDEQAGLRFEEYYRYLNCGFRAPVSAGSMGTESGRHALDYVGAARVYVRIPGSYSYGAFFKNLKLGKSWATCGPLVSMGINGKDPGTVIQAKKGEKVKISVGARSLRTLSRVEVIYNGTLAASLPVSTTENAAFKDFSIDVAEGGWIAARAYEARITPASPARYAHTSPAFIEVDGKQPIDKAQAEAFLARVTQKQDSLRKSENESHPLYASLMGWYDSARKHYEDLLK